MESVNGHIEEFIQYYAQLEKEPNYALLIKGAWGCGKTRLVNECTEKLEEDGKIKLIYVSLYGVTSPEDIETKFFQVLHPVLSSKKAILAGRIAKSALKGIAKFDWDGDGNADGSMNLSIPNINLAEFATSTSDCLLVFDDLERCGMDLTATMGYINHFVEKDGYKAIIIADEDKLKGAKKDDEDSEDDNRSYLEVKEKLIGKTLEVMPDINSVYNSFGGDNINDEKLKRYFAANKDRVISIFQKSGYNNLRTLRKIFLDFERLWDELEDEVRKKEDLIARLIEIFTFLSIELHAGGIQPSEISKMIGVGSLARRVKAEANKESGDCKFNGMDVKYNLDVSETVLNVSDWIELFDKGAINSKLINEAAKLTKYFKEENMEEWMWLWGIYDLDDEEFSEYQQSMQERFDKREYVIFGEIKHVFGMMLHHVREGFVEGDVKDVMQECKRYIDDIFKKHEVVLDENYFYRIREDSSYAGMRYTDIETSEFKELSDLLSEKIKHQQAVKLADRIGEVRVAMHEDSNELYNMLCPVYRERHEFQHAPVMQNFPVNEFVRELLEMKGPKKRWVADVLKDRYVGVMPGEAILDEYDWLKGVAESFAEELKGHPNRPSRLSLEHVSTKLDQAVASLDAVIERAKPVSEEAEVPAEPEKEVAEPKEE